MSTSPLSLAFYLRLYTEAIPNVYCELFNWAFLRGCMCCHEDYSNPPVSETANWHPRRSVSLEATHSLLYLWSSFPSVHVPDTIATCTHVWYVILSKFWGITPYKLPYCMSQKIPDPKYPHGLQLCNILGDFWEPGPSHGSSKQSADYCWQNPYLCLSAATGILVKSAYNITHNRIMVCYSCNSFEHWW